MQSVWPVGATSRSYLRGRAIHWVRHASSNTKEAPRVSRSQRVSRLPSRLQWRARGCCRATWPLRLHSLPVLSGVSPSALLAIAVRPSPLYGVGVRAGTLTLNRGSRIVCSCASSGHCADANRQRCAAEIRRRRLRRLASRTDLGDALDDPRPHRSYSPRVQLTSSTIAARVPRPSPDETTITALRPNPLYPYRRPSVESVSVASGSGEAICAVAVIVHHSCPSSHRPPAKQRFRCRTWLGPCPGNEVDPR